MTFLAINSAIGAFGAANAAIGAAVTAAGSIDAAANTAALNPALGLIGQDFIAAFTGAQASYLSSVAELGVLHGAMAASAAGTVVAYSASESAGVAGLLSAAV
ncbi:hypothetical protein P0W64_15360 [Tsukamurella sp. 8F]|uniref:hypothetical protein n=1 Tax=unclassified Tsukamurella TaxID=2633480 RepID=UPI0023B8FE06|nr:MULTISPECIES: hypothetical protein [unclassified Tsukamurella]MDF0530899.1 hypothetical protein [Tsukamurella sp. 8J]MDF0588156.1 hypothetical protein [Tsukamurella sp. 8F]